MNIVLWTACALSVPADLPEPDNWKNYGRPDWAYEQAMWQVIAEPAPSTELPAEVLEMAPETKNAFLITLEPTRADEAGYKFMNDIVVSAAQKCRGAVITGPMGLIRFDSEGAEIRS